MVFVFVLALSRAVLTNGGAEDDDGDDQEYNLPSPQFLRLGGRRVLAALCPRRRIMLLACSRIEPSSNKSLCWSWTGPPVSVAVQCVPLLRLLIDLSL